MSYEEIYDDWANDYDLMYRDKDGGIKEVKRLCARILSDVPTGQRILEIGCGTGQVAAALAQLGHQVTGLDFSNRKLSIARARAERLGLDIAFEDGDFLKQEYRGDYDLVFAMSSFVTHFLDENQQRQCVEQIRACVGENGKAVISLYNYSQLMSTEPDDAISHVAPVQRKHNNSLYFQRRIWHGLPRDPIHDCRYYIVPDGDGDPVRIFSMQRRAITPVDLSAMMRDAGFAQLRWFTPTEADYYQTVCLASVKHFATETQGSAADALTPPRRYLVWDGSPSSKPKIEAALRADMRSTFLHYTHILDTPDEVAAATTKLHSIRDWVIELEQKLGKFEFSSSVLNRSDFSERAPRSLAQAYLAAQVMMSAKFDQRDQIVLLPSGDDLKRCIEMIRAISRREEIAEIVFG